MRELAVKHDTSAFLLFCDVLEVASAIRMGRQANPMHPNRLVEEAANLAMSRLRCPEEAHSVMEKLHAIEHGETLEN
ncbi:MAG: hypothetical protein ACRDBH_02300 [Bosea sp. (in: a-proteobacteria)]